MVSELRRERDHSRRQRTRKDLLDAAAACFAGRGYHATLIADIVQIAGVGQGTFYRHFKDKTDIFGCLMDDAIEILLAEFHDMTATPPRNLEEYRAASLAALTRMARSLESHKGMYQMLLREAPAIGAEMEMRLSGLFDLFANLAASYLDHAIVNGFARPCRSEVVSQCLVGMAQRIMNVWWRGAFPALALEELVMEINELAFSGFGYEER